MTQRPFTPEELEIIQINHFIFHLISSEAEEAILLDEVSLTEEQAGFFKDRIREANRRVGEYEFIREEGFDVHEDLQAILADMDGTEFVEISKRLANQFQQLHNGKTKDGVLITARIELPNAGLHLVFLMKMDQHETYQFTIHETEEGKQASLELLQNTLTDASDAVQKIALIEPMTDRAWDVLAYDKYAKGGQVGQFFQEFLGMQTRSLDVFYTRDLMKATKQVAKDLSLDERESQTIKEASMEYLQEAEVYEQSSFLDHLTQSFPQESRQVEVRAATTQNLGNMGMIDLSFEPRPDQLPSSSRYSTITTSEGVQIRYSGAREHNYISVEEMGNGRVKIIITTDRVSEK